MWEIVLSITVKTSSMTEEKFSQEAAIIYRASLLDSEFDIAPLADQPVDIPARCGSAATVVWD